MARDTLKEIPINGPYHANTDENAVMDGRSALLQDVYVDEFKANNPRPGSTVNDENFGLGAATQGAYEWKQKGYYVFVQGGIIFVKKGKNITPVQVTGATLNVSGRVTFAYNGTHLVMANGGKMVWTTDGITATVMAHAQAPVTVTHVGFADGYILANTADKVYRSALDDALTWDSTWFFEAESIPDSVNAVHVADSKILAFGPATVEIWYNAGLSGATPFARQQVIEHGVIAPDSIVRANNTFYWLNNERRLTFLNGTIVQSISLPVDRAFNDMVTVNDAYANLWRVGGKYFYVISFPTEKKSWCYDIALDRWYPWGYWYNGAYQHLLYSTMTYMQAWGQHLAGSRLTDKIYAMSLSAYGDASDEIRCENVTGWTNFGADVTKKLKRVRLTVKRGAVTLDATDLTKKPKLILQTRRDGKKEWSNERIVDLGGIGDTLHYVTLNRFGAFTDIQFRFVMSDFAPFVLTKAQAFLEFGRD